jgi:hypothetical protein
MPPSETSVDALDGLTTQKIVLFLRLTEPREDEMATVCGADGAHLVFTLNNSLQE